MRALVQRDLGADSLGCYTAAWTISVTYVGLILAAMATDYYPRLAAIIQDHQAVNVLVNQQTEVALAISGPIFLAVLALMPWIVEIFFSAKFAAAVEVLRWQVLGDVLKITSWPLGFIMLAAAAGRTLIVSDAIAILIFVVLTVGLLPLLGLAAAGISFFRDVRRVSPDRVCLGPIQNRISLEWNREARGGRRHGGRLSRFRRVALVRNGSLVSRVDVVCFVERLVFVFPLGRHNQASIATLIVESGDRVARVRLLSPGKRLGGEGQATQDEWAGVERSGGGVGWFSSVNRGIPLPNGDRRIGPLASSTEPCTPGGLGTEPPIASPPPGLPCPFLTPVVRLSPPATQSPVSGRLMRYVRRCGGRRVTIALRSSERSARRPRWGKS